MYKCTSENIHLLISSDRFPSPNNIIVRFAAVYCETWFRSPSRIYFSLKSAIKEKVLTRFNFPASTERRVDYISEVKALIKVPIAAN